MTRLTHQQKMLLLFIPREMSGVSLSRVVDCSGVFFIKRYKVPPPSSRTFVQYKFCEEATNILQHVPVEDSESGCLKGAQDLALVQINMKHVALCHVHVAKSTHVHHKIIWRTDCFQWQMQRDLWVILWKAQYVQLLSSRHLEINKNFSSECDEKGVLTICPRCVYPRFKVFIVICTVRKHVSLYNKIIPLLSKECQQCKNKYTQLQYTT